MSTKTPSRVIPKIGACIDCGACNVACKSTWDLPANDDRIAVVTHNEGRAGGRFGEGEISIPMACYHCADAPCLQVCPTGALSRDDNGLVQVDGGRCIGCSYCHWACPFGAPQFPDETRSMVDAGSMDKCTGCVERVEEGKRPMCVEVCPTDALVYGTPSEIAAELRTDRSNALFSRGLGDVVFGGSP